LKALDSDISPDPREDPHDEETVKNGKLFDSILFCGTHRFRFAQLTVGSFCRLGFESHVGKRVLQSADSLPTFSTVGESRSLTARVNAN